MGRLIDADKLIEYWLTPPNNIGWADEIECVNNQPTVEAIPKDQYEASLKSDMVAILKELEVEIYKKQYNYNNRWVVNHRNISELINEKINKLKENTDESI